MSEIKIDPKQGIKLKGADKTARIPIKVVPLDEKIKKPEWIRAKLPTGKKFFEIKNILRDQKMHTVCEEASCPNIGECFSKGTATFMIMGDICTRRCPFCDVGHGRPNPLDADEPKNLAESVAAMKLRYVVITSVDPTKWALPTPPSARWCAPATTPTSRPRRRWEIVNSCLRHTGRLKETFQTACFYQPLLQSIDTFCKKCLLITHQTAFRRPFHANTDAK
jgi:hypothetical protein